jgi:hypothetical protein
VQYFARLGEIWRDLARFGEIWGEAWRGLARFGEAWRDKGDSRVLLAGIQKNAKNAIFENHVFLRFLAAGWGH